VRGRIGIALLGAVVAAPALVCAQSTLSLDEAIAAAMSRNRALQSARSSVAEAQAGVREAQSAFFPRITAAESWQRSDQPVFVFSSLLSSRRFAASNFAIDALNHPGPIGFFRTSVGLEQVIVDGGRQRSAASAAVLRRDIAAHQTDQAAMDVMVAVATTYGRVLAAQAARRAADAGLESSREDLARVEGRRDAGMATEAAVLSLRVHLADLQQRLIQADGDGAIARAELNRLMGAPIDGDYVAEDPPLRVDESFDRTALVAAALEARPSIKAGDAAAKVAATMQSASHAALIPQVSAQAGVEFGGTTFSDRSSSWIIGGELRWSFSPGGAELARMKAAAEAASRARLDLEDTRAAVEVDVVSAIRRLEAARARQAVGAAAVEQARESQRIIRNRFEAGIAGTDEVLRASTAVLDADAQRTAALVDGLVARAMLDRAIGRGPAGKGTP
jgi:outer membrane protein TolC